MQFSNDPAIWLKELFINAGLSYSLSSFLSTAGLEHLLASLHEFELKVFQRPTGDDINRLAETN